MYCNMLKYNCTACNYVSTYYSTGGALRMHRYSLTCFLYHWLCNYLDFESPLLHHVQCSLIIACTHTLCTCNYQHVHTHARYSTGASRLHKYTGRRRSLSVALCLNLIILASSSFSFLKPSSLSSPSPSSYSSLMPSYLYL